MTRQEELEAMSEFDINSKVAELARKDGEKFVCMDGFYPNAYVWSESHKKELDYCNNPADIMPLVLENNINLLNQYWCDGDGVNKLAMDFTHEIESKHKNVYRAACIVLILMKE